MCLKYFLFKFVNRLVFSLSSVVLIMMNSSAEMDKLRAAASLEIQSSNLVTEKKPPPDAAASIPNGGLTAWLQVVGAFFVFLNSRYIHRNHLRIFLEP